MTDFSPEFELITNSLIGIFSGMLWITWVYDLFVEYKDPEVFFLGLFILGFFTVFPLNNARHWYKEIRSLNRKVEP